MTDYKTTLRQDQPRTSASGTRQRGPELGLAAAIMLIAAVRPCEETYSFLLRVPSESGPTKSQGE